LEACLLDHPAVADCAVIAVPGPNLEEFPKAFVVKQSTWDSANDESTKMILMKHVEQLKSRHKWLRGGVAFVDVIPKSPAGKILRRVLKDSEKAARERNVAKL
jgi:acyl-coenzyme A synthetase/AMP-(fatty) acid ligase